MIYGQLSNSLLLVTLMDKTEITTERRTDAKPVAVIVGRKETTTSTCDAIKKHADAILHSDDFSYRRRPAMNQFRRHVGRNNPECLQQHFQVFQQAFETMRPKKQVILHIPKCGGTSICSFLKTDNNTQRTVPTKLPGCQIPSFRPIWCFLTTSKRGS